MSRAASHSVSSSRTRGHEAPVSSSRSRALDSTVKSSRSRAQDPSVGSSRSRTHDLPVASSRSRTHDVPVASSRSRAQDSTVGSSRSRGGEHAVIGSEHRRSQASSSSHREAEKVPSGHTSSSRSSNDIASCFGRPRGGELVPYQGSSAGGSARHSSSSSRSRTGEGTVARREQTRRYEGSTRLGDDLVRYNGGRGGEVQASRTKIEINDGNQQIKITVEQVNMHH